MKRDDKELARIKATTQKPLNVEFLIDGCNSHTSIHSLSLSNMASIRLRTLVAIDAVKELKSLPILSDGDNRSQVDVLVVGKVSNANDAMRPNRWLERIEKVKSNNGVLIVDYTDHHIETKSEIGNFYRQVIRLADLVVCSSDKLQEHLAGLNFKTVVIEEPVEVPIVPATPKVNAHTTILWFGHASNLSYLIDFLGKNYTNSAKARLIVMTNAYPLPAIYEEFLSKSQFNNLEINVVPWSKDDMIKAAQISDFCILPTGYADKRKSGASSNRLLTALALGLPTLADDMESYKRFSKYFKRLNSENLMQMIENPSCNVELQKEAQSIIKNGYSFGKMTNDWKNVIKMDSLSFTSMNVKSSPVKLNLGCGDKILSGYINVDVVAARAGKEPDIICDLHDLSVFQNNSVDEILAVHVIEHFWQWEVIDILKEWVRVLKPGGKMILECPNLISAAEEFLKNPDVAALGGAEGQRSMWVFYGDPGWKDPLMIHRWGYTPKSLARVMRAAGIINLQQEPAQFKLREPRDMRITGIKPSKGDNHAK